VTRIILFLQFMSALLTGSAATAQIAVQIDHVTYCAKDLDSIQSAFRSVGLHAQYGGTHAGVTHMALIGFRDSSYIELIAPETMGTPMPAAQRWRKSMLEDAGPCAWAINVPDVRAELNRLASLGFSVTGPLLGTRKKPDGTILNWETGFVLPGDPGAVLPFVIHDQTNRHQRVAPSLDLANTEITGIARVVIAVQNLSTSIEKFRLAYGWPPPKIQDSVELEAKLAIFEHAPVILACPRDASGLLNERIAKYGDQATAFLLGTTEFDTSTKRFMLSAVTRSIGGQRLRWFTQSALRGYRLGILDVAAQ